MNDLPKSVRISLVLSVIGSVLALSVFRISRHASGSEDKAVTPRHANAIEVMPLASLRKGREPLVPESVRDGASRKGVLEVRVLGPSGPVQEAELFVEGAGAGSPALSSANGVAIVPLFLDDSLRMRRVVVRAEGYHPVERLVPRTASHVEFHLSAPVELNGIVLDARGRPLDELVAVLAWPARLGKNLDPQKVREVMDQGLPQQVGDPIRMAHCEASGEFKIEGLGPNEAVCVAAGAPGFATLVCVTVPGGEDRTTLEARAVYGAKVRLVAGDGGLVGLSPTLEKSRRVSWGCELEAVETSDAPSLVAALAGLEPAQLRSSGNTFVCTYLSEGSTLDVGPCQFRYSLPGYVPLDVTLRPSRVDAGLLTVDAVLVNAVGERGAIRILPQGCHDSVRLAFEDAVQATEFLGDYTLALFSAEEGDKGSYTFGLKLDLADSMLVTDVPAGTFSYRISSLSRFCSIPDDGQEPGIIRVAPGGESLLVLELEDYSTVSLDLRSAEEGPYLDAASFTIAHGRPDAVDRSLSGILRLRCDSFPYSVGLVHAGIHTIRGWGPRFGSPADDSGRLTIEVGPGQDFLCSILLGP